MFICLCLIYGYFCATMAQLSSCGRDYMAKNIINITKARNIYNMALYRKYLPTSVQMVRNTACLTHRDYNMISLQWVPVSNTQSFSCDWSAVGADIGICKLPDGCNVHTGLWTPELGNLMFPTVYDSFLFLWEYIFLLFR